MNVLTAIVAIILIALVFNPLMATMVTPIGFSIAGVQEGYPADQAGVQPGLIYTSIDGVNISSTEELINALNFVKPNQTVILGNHNASCGNKLPLPKLFPLKLSSFSEKRTLIFC